MIKFITWISLLTRKVVVGRSSNRYILLYYEELQYRGIIWFDKTNKLSIHIFIKMVKEAEYSNLAKKRE